FGDGQARTAEIEGRQSASLQAWDRAGRAELRNVRETAGKLWIQKEIFQMCGDEAVLDARAGHGCSQERSGVSGVGAQAGEVRGAERGQQAMIKNSFHGNGMIARAIRSNVRVTSIRSNPCLLSKA